MNQTIKHRSIKLSGRTVSLEDDFWTRLRQIAAERGLSAAELVRQIDHERTGNLSSAIRLFILSAKP